MSISDPDISEKLEDFRHLQSDQVLKKAETLEKIGIDEYMEGR